MPNKCGVVKCTGNYNESNKCRVFKLPKDEVDRQKWIAVLPPREHFVVDAAKFYICERHWPSDTPMVKIPGGSTRPTQPPSIFDVPISCLPTPKPPPRPSKQEDKQLQHFLKKDKITFSDFVPEKELKKYDNIVISRTDDRFVCLFMSKDFTECESTIIVENKATLCSPLILTAYKKEIRVPLGKILHPNNGLSSYAQFHEAVHTVRNYVIPTVDRILEMAAVLEQLEFQDSKQQKKMEFITHTADFIQCVLNWWNHVNVSSKGQDARLKDPHRAVQVSSSTTLDTYAEQFEAANSGHGASRVECLTHDTKKALVQTMRGLAALCRHLLDTAGFSYVLLREIQSDRIEGEFGVYRQSTGGNAFMTVGDVSGAAKKRLARHAATFLKSVEMDDQPKVHDCIGPLIVDDAASIENSISDVTLTNNKKSCCAYVAGWLEGKCSEDLSFSDEEPLVNSDVKNFIEEVSRGSLTVPHECTYQLVEVGLCFVKNAHHRACCCRRLCMILSTMGSYYNLDSVSQCQKLLRSLSNVLLHGLHNLEKDQQRNGVLLQTSVKKARMSE